MKKIISSIIALILVLSLGLTAVAEDSVIGSWVLDKDAFLAALAEEMGGDVEQLKAVFGAYLDEMMNTLDYRFTFNEDGTFVMDVNNMDQVVHNEGTYTLEDGQIVLVTEEETEHVSYRIEEGKLIIPDEKIVLLPVTDDTIVGEWEADFSAMAEQIAAAYSVSVDDALALLKSSYSTCYIFTEDGQFIMDVTNDGQSIHVSGTYTVEGDQLTMVPAESNVEDANEASTVTFRFENGQLIIGSEAGEIALNRIAE